MCSDSLRRQGVGPVGERGRAHPPRDSENRSARQGVLTRYVGKGWGERGRAHPPRDFGESCHEKVGSDSLCRQGVGREDTRIRREILRVALREKGF